MPIFLALKSLVGFKVHENNIPVDIEWTKQASEFFDARGVTSSRFRLKHKISGFRERFKMTKERRERHIRSVKDKKSKVAKAKDKSACKQKATDDLEAKTAAAKAEHDAAKRNEDEATEELDEDKAVLEELEEQEKKIMEDLLEAENDLKILTEIEEHHKTAQGKAKLPLGGERAPEELCGAVEDLVPSFQALRSDFDCPKETVKKALNFLFLNGAEGARMTQRAGDNIVLLRKQLAKILHPDLHPPREPSLSPKSKEKALAAELHEDADQIEKNFEGERQAKRKSVVSGTAAYVPPAKKQKLSLPSELPSETVDEITSLLSPKALAALGVEPAPGLGFGEDGPPSASTAEEEEKDASETSGDHHSPTKAQSQ